MRRLLPFFMIPVILGFSGCKSRDPHFSRAEELIAAVEQQNLGTKPDYANYRYDEVLAELAQVPVGDPNYWKAREWTQKIQLARGTIKEPSKPKAAEASPKPPSPTLFTEPRPAPEPPPDIIEKHKFQGKADLALLSATGRIDKTGAYLSGLAWNKSKRTLRINAKITALDKTLAPIASTTARIMGKGTAPNARAGFRVALGAFDPVSVPTPPKGDSPDAQGPTVMPPPFDPSEATLIRIEFEDSRGFALTWVDARSATAPRRTIPN